MLVLSDYLKKRFSGKQVWIVGVGREGISSYALLRHNLPDLEIILVDDLPLEKLNPLVTDFTQDAHTRFLETSQISATLSQNIVAFKTPGMPSSHPVIVKLLQVSAELTANTQLFFELLAQLRAQPTTIGITGTKGKSTTTSMIYHVLKENGKMAFLAGNIGTPPLNLVDQLFSLDNPAEALIVLELSSHQLRELRVSPAIAVIQNITPEHLDYYPDFQTYQTAKQSITKYQNVKNIVIYCPRFDAVVNILSDLAQRYTYDVEPSNPSSLTAFATTDALYYGSEKIIEVARIPLVGKHNLYNTLPAVIIGKLQGLENAQISRAIESFKALPHRLEHVNTSEGVKYFNDSQATTPEAAIAALQSFRGAPVHLIAGGSDKGVDLSDFAAAILENRVKTLILFPPMGEVIDNLVQKKLKPGQLAVPLVFHVNSMSEAVKIARQHAAPGDVVLLSPACASFGIFKNYQDRGDQFKKEVTHPLD